MGGRYHLYALVRSILHRQRLRFVTKTVTKPGFSLTIAKDTRMLLSYTNHRIACLISRGHP